MGWIEYLSVFIVLITLLYLIAIMPKIGVRKNKLPKRTYYAHRGLHDNRADAPENSLKAFSLAIEKGYGIELDVQLTKDRIPVVAHDYHLKRICKADKKIDELTLLELKEYRIYQSEEQIPTLVEVLRLVDGKVPLIVELKMKAIRADLCEIVGPILRNYRGDYIIESFNPLALRWYRRNYPSVIRGQLASHFHKDDEKGNYIIFFFLQNLLLDFITKPDFIAFNYKYRKMMSFTLCRKVYHIPTFAWTIKSEQDVERCKDSFGYFIFEGFLPPAGS